MTELRVVRRAGVATVVNAAGQPLHDCERFLQRLQVRGLSAHTVEAYAYDLLLIHRWLTESSVQLDAVTEDDLHAFLAWERGRGSQPKSINRRLHTFRLYFRFATGRELAGSLVAQRHRRVSRPDFEMGLQRVARAPSRQLRVKEARVIVEPLTQEQVRELLASFRRYRDLCIAHLMLLCGLRSGEVLRARLLDFDFEDRRVRVRGKGAKERAVPLPPLVITLVRRYLTLERPSATNSDALFVVLQGRHRGEPMTRTALRRIFRTRRSAKKLANANPHRLRHTFGTDMARSGVRLPILQQMMGHAYAETTLQYVNVSLADVAAEFDRATANLERRYA